MLEINLLVISHQEQRYPTVGDWWFTEISESEAKLEIRISDMGDPYLEFLVGVHEQIEAMLCLKRGISEHDVTHFDKFYEKQRLKGVSSYQGEPGDHPKAPYRKEHFFATSIERLICAELEVDWEEYDEKVSAF